MIPSSILCCLLVLWPKHLRVAVNFFPGGSISFIHKRQEESYFLQVVVVDLFIDHQVKFSVLDELSQVLPFSIKGFRWVQFDLLNFGVIVIHYYIRHWFGGRR